MIENGLPTISLLGISLEIYILIFAYFISVYISVHKYRAKSNAEKNYKLKFVQSQKDLQF